MFGNQSEIYSRTVNIDGKQRHVRFFGMKGDLKWLAQVFKLPWPYSSEWRSSLGCVTRLCSDHAPILYMLSPRHWKGNGVARGNRT